MAWSPRQLSPLLFLAGGCSFCSSPEAAPGASADAGSEVDASDASIDVADAASEDAGEDVYGSDWDDGTFLTDKSVWSPVPDNGGCGLFVAKVVPDPFPKRVWETCGPGCQEADANWPIPQQNEVLVGGATAGERSGELFLRLKHSVYGGGKISVVSRLSDGAPIAAIQLRNGDCGVVGWANDATFVFPIFNKAYFARGGIVGGVSTGSPVTWGKWLPEIGWVGSTFAWDEGWGVGAGSSLRVTTSPDDAKLKVIDPATNEYEVTGRGKLVVWPAGNGAPENAIKSYTTSGGLKYLWTAPKGYVASVSLSDTKLVWIVVEGPQYLSKYSFETARLYWSPLATDASGIVVAEGPVLAPAVSAFTELRTGGDFAASQGCWKTSPTEGACPVFVVQLSTGKVWKIPPRPGSAYHSVMAMSQSTILVAESNYPGTASDSQNIRRFLRFDTANLDALETAW
jgi:hypothetical protein